MLRRLIVGLALGVAAAILAWLAGTLSIARNFEAQTYDWRLRLTADPAGAESRIVLVEINESSLRALEPAFGRWPWPRMVHASLIEFLTRAGARVIAYDVLFTEPDARSGFPVAGRTMTGAESDAALVSAVRRAGNVVLLADATFAGLDSGGAAPGAAADNALPGTAYRPGPGFEARDLRLPFSALKNAAMAVGHNFLVLEPDGSARRIRPFIEHQGVAVPSLGLAAALAAEHVTADDVRLEGADGRGMRIGNRRMPLLADAVPARPGDTPQPSRQVLLNHRKPAGDGRTYHAESAFDVLVSEDNEKRGLAPLIDPSVFRDKVVFVGTTASGTHDVFTTPFAGGAPGMLVHAALADDVLSNRFMGRAPVGVDLAVTSGAGLAAAVIAVMLPVGWATAAVVALAAALFGWLTREVGQGSWIAAIAPAAALTFALFGGVAWQYFVEGREKRQVKRLFGRYVSKDVFDHLIADPSLARLGGQRREMTVLFSDIRGFTTASERSTPEAIVLQLNEYFTAMVEVLFRHQGTLDKFVGDMVMGLFGAPVADPRHADHAVGAALEMIASLERLNEKWAAAGQPPLDIGIGINSGEMIAGNIGSDTIMSYTVIGDAVNLGSRLESLNKEYGTHILISQATRDRLTIEVTTRLIGDVKVKGKTQAVAVHEVVGR